MALKAVIFDLYKTLGEFKPLITDEQVTSLLRKNGYEIYPQAWRHAFGFVVFVDYPKEGYSTHRALFRQVFDRLDADVDDSTLNKVSKLFRDNPFRLYREAGQALASAKDAGLKTAVATSTPRPFFIKGIEPIVAHLDYICTGYEAGYDKSNPQIYRRVLDRLEVEPGETVVVGDDPVLDISNPHRLGMRTIQIIRGGTPSEHADETAENVLEAVKIALMWI